MNHADLLALAELLEELDRDRIGANASDTDRMHVAETRRIVTDLLEESIEP